MGESAFRANLEMLRRELNEPQWDAVRHREGPLLILAGAGSGKTRALTYRIAHLVAYVGVDPHAILALTFTNKAAREMRRRVEELLGSRAGRLWLGTFHGTCLRILRTHADLLDLGPSFAVYDSDDQVRLAKAVVVELGLDPKRFRPNALVYQVGRAKDEGLGPEDLEVPPYNPWAEALREFYRRYQRRLREARALDFGDLQLETLRLFEEHPDVTRHYQERFQHLLIDEYQDTNHVQYRLARQLAGVHGNVCVVGDDDQSIYGWRGADVRNILAFEKDYPGATVIKLEQNYRSTAAILDAASAVVARNRSRHPKTLWTDRRGGEPVRVHEAPTEEDEAAWVAHTVASLRQQEVPHAAVAVLYRMHALSRPFEEAFLRLRIPYVVYGGLRFYDRKEVKDALAYLRLLLNPDDPVAFRRVINVPPRGIGDATVQRIEAVAREAGVGPGRALEIAVERGVLGTRSARAVASFANLVEGWRQATPGASIRDLLVRVLEDSGYLDALKGEQSEQGEARLENLEELLNAAEAFEAEEAGGLAAFLDRAALVSDQDRSPDRLDAVTLMTLHSAKGLEYPVVFLAGLEEGVFPHQRSSDSPEELEEERRLCYVGMTRAMDRLYLTRARMRRVYGAEGFFRPRSRFLEELPPEVYRPAGAGERVTDARPEEAAVPPDPSEGRTYAPEPDEADYRPGMRVRHPKYGRGEVSRVDGRGPRAKVTVRFRDGTTRKFLAALSGLEVFLDT